MTVIMRSLSATQTATRRALLDAAVTLASEGGYDAVGMRQVAARAGVSAATAYQYFSSKDHILVDALVELVSDTTSALEARPPRSGRSAADRVAAALRRAVRQVEQQPELYVALTRAYISGSPEVAHARGALESSTRRWIEAAIDDGDIREGEGAVEVLEAVLFAAMVGLVTGGRAPGEIGDVLERAVRVILRQ